MADYKAMYLAAMDAMERAIETLTAAQQRCEDLYVATSGLVDDVPLEHVRPFVLGFAGEIEAEHPDVVAEIESTGTLSGPAVECIRAALADAKKRGSATWQA